MPLSCAIVGATSNLQFPAISISAVCDPSMTDGAALSAALECPWYASPAEMLTAQPGLESLWIRPTSKGELPFDPLMLAAFGRHLFLDLSLPITMEQYNRLLSICNQKGAMVQAVFPPFPALPDLGEIYAVEVKGFADGLLLSPNDHLPTILNQGLSLLLAMGGTPARLQGSFDTSSAARLARIGGADIAGIQVNFHGGAMGQLLLLPPCSSVEAGWTVSVAGSEGSCCFTLPLDQSPVCPEGFPVPNFPSLYPTLLSLRSAVSTSFRQGGSTLYL